MYESAIRASGSNLKAARQTDLDITARPLIGLSALTWPMVTRLKCQLHVTGGARNHQPQLHLQSAEQLQRRTRTAQGGRASICPGHAATQPVCRCRISGGNMTQPEPLAHASTHHWYAGSLQGLGHNQTPHIKCRECCRNMLC
jgi:hypothetical protein